jgi:hypothetical protein
MRSLVFVLSRAAFVFSCLPTVAQDQPAPQAAPSATTTVSGRVTCADTNHPARFAAVQLIPETQQPAQTSDWANVKNEKDMAKLLAKSINNSQKSTGLSAVSALDGSFEMPQVPAGTYYVVAQLKGYLSPLDTLSDEDKYKGGADAIKKIQALAEKIVVQDAPVRVDLRLERGGSINGVIRYDDGTPATGVTPVRMVMQEDGKWKTDSFNPGGGNNNTTDDRGHYRISGLAKGKYAIKASLPTRQSISGLGGSHDMHFVTGDALDVYSGGVFREKDIKPIEVGAGEDVDGIDIAFPVDNLHIVSGTVTAKADGHSLNNGTVHLDDPETKAWLRMTKIEDDGSFKFNYVPEGQYLLSAAGGDVDKSAPGGAFVQMIHPTILKKYQDATLPLEVKGDQTTLILQLADKPAADAPAKPEKPVTTTQIVVY